MINNDTGKYLYRLSVVFISYLLVGSFVFSRDYIELVYLIVLYVSIIILKLLHNKNHILGKE